MQDIQNQVDWGPWAIICLCYITIAFHNLHQSFRVITKRQSIMGVRRNREKISSYYYCQQMGNATFKLGISSCASLKIILNYFQNSSIISVHRLCEISSLKLFYFELSQRKTFGYQIFQITTKYTTTERSMAPGGIDYFVIPKCSDTSMSVKKCQRYFKGFIFLCKKVHLIDC